MSTFFQWILILGLVKFLTILVLVVPLLYVYLWWPWKKRKQTEQLRSRQTLAAARAAKGGFAHLKKEAEERAANGNGASQHGSTDQNGEHDDARMSPATIKAKAQELAQRGKSSTPDLSDSATGPSHRFARPNTFSQGRNGNHAKLPASLERLSIAQNQPTDSARAKNGGPTSSRNGSNGNSQTKNGNGGASSKSGAVQIASNGASAAKKTKRGSDTTTRKASSAKKTAKKPALATKGRTKIDKELGILFTQAPKVHDDLKEISGVAKVLEAKLHEQGIYTFQQIALWNNAQVESFSTLLSFKNRIERDDWRGQCKKLHKEKYGASA